jgi:hypothetical protein
VNGEQFAAALKGQDPEAVEELVNSYGDRLLRSAFLLCGNETEAQDIVQDTFLQAIRSVHRFQGRSTIYTWLHAMEEAAAIFGWPNYYLPFLVRAGHLKPLGKPAQNACKWFATVEIERMSCDPV